MRHVDAEALLTPGCILLVDMSTSLCTAGRRCIHCIDRACNRALLEGRLPDVSVLAGLPPPVENPIASVLHAVCRGALVRASSDCRTINSVARWRKCLILPNADAGWSNPICADRQRHSTRLVASSEAAQPHRHLLDDTLSIEDIARDNNISSRYMQKLFRLEGTSPSDYLLEAKAHAGKGSTRRIPNWRSVASVAYSSGFTNASHFSTAYKRRFGYSPRDESLQPLSTVHAGPTGQRRSPVETARGSMLCNPIQRQRRARV